MKLIFEGLRSLLYRVFINVNFLSFIKIMCILSVKILSYQEILKIFPFLDIFKNI